MRSGMHERRRESIRKGWVFAFLLWVLLPAVPVSGYASEAPKHAPLTPGMRASLSPHEARVGDIVTLTLQYALPKGASLPQKMHIEGLKGIEVLAHEVKFPKPIPEAIQMGAEGEICLKLLVDRLNALKTGPLHLSYKDKNGATHVLKTDPVTLNVKSNLGPKPEEARLAPIYGIIPTTASWFAYLPWILGGLLVLAVAALLILWVRRHRRQTASPEDTTPPHLRAQREMCELQAEGLFEKGEIKAFYFRISEILRRYLEALRGFPAAEYTTEEIAAVVRSPEDRDLLKLLGVADGVKFADMRPTPARQEETLKQAHAYIQKTGSVFEAAQGGRARESRRGWRLVGHRAGEAKS